MIHDGEPWRLPSRLIEEERNYSPIWLYNMPEDDEIYAVGIDTAEGKVRNVAAGPVDTSGRDPDFNAMSVQRVSDGLEVATYRSNYAYPILLRDVRAILTLYTTSQPPLAVPETIGAGYALAESLRDLGYPHIWLERVWLRLEQTYEERLGWRTNAQNRNILIKSLQQELDDGTCGVQCRRTAIDMSSMARSKLGKHEAPPGAHDDLAVARMLANMGRKTLLPGNEKDIKSGAEEPVRRSQSEKDAEWAAELVEQIEQSGHDGAKPIDLDLAW